MAASTVFCGACATIYRQGKNELNNLPGLSDPGTGRHVVATSVLPEQIKRTNDNNDLKRQQVNDGTFIRKSTAVLAVKACTKACYPES